jgi:hypothetical protein
VLNDAMAKMHGIAKFCTHVLHMEGEEVFGSQKHKPDMPLGTKWNHTGQKESTLLVHELKQGPLKLELLVVL